tara:strand:+ start:186 stop:617 length:432 start_codon:yes stop_codon:yes gene_type:complete
LYVSDALAHKGRNLVTVRPDMSIEAAIELLTVRKIGGAPVCQPSGKILGLLTERDILHGTAKHGAAALELKVEELMSGKFFTCTPEDDLKQVRSIMTNKHVRHVLVLVDGKLDNIISIGDVMRARLEEAQLEVDVLRDYARIR